MKSLLRSARVTGPALVVGALLGGVAALVGSVPGCVSPDAFYRDAGRLPEGAGGSLFGAGGELGAGGMISGLGGQGMGGRTGVGGAGLGGTTGAGGRTGMGGSGIGGTPGAGGSGVGGRIGTGGSGMGGAPGVGGSGAGGSVVDAGMGAGGAVVTGCPPGIFCENFESFATGAVPPLWTRTGGSAGDFAVAVDGTNVLSQNKNSSSPREFYSSGVNNGAPWSGATTVAGRIKITAAGSSGITTAMLCLRYTAANVGYCLALMPNMGAQIQVRTTGTINEMSNIFPTTISLGTNYDVQLSVSAAGVLTASMGATTLGTFTPTTAIASGFVAFATQSAVAEFDNLVVAQP